MNFSNFFQSTKYEHLLRYMSYIFVGSLIFGAGIYVGHRVTEFSYQWGNNYVRDFGGPHSPFNLNDPDDMPPTPHGAFGTVIGVNLPSFAVKAPNEAEKVVMIGTTTLIRSLRSDASTTDIHVGSNVIILGEPDNQGRVQATFIRIVPGLPIASSTQ